MSVIPLTIFFSLLLAGLFIVLFAHEQRRRRFASAERDSLLPLADEQGRTVHAAESHARAGRVARHAPGDAHDHDHAHDGGACGCRDGSRPPCDGCTKRHEFAASFSK